MGESSVSYAGEHFTYLFKDPAGPGLDQQLVERVVGQRTRVGLDLDDEVVARSLIGGGLGHSVKRGGIVGGSSAESEESRLLADCDDILPTRRECGTTRFRRGVM